MKNKVIIIILLFLSTKCFSADDAPAYAISEQQGIKFDIDKLKMIDMEDKHTIDINHRFFGIYDGHNGTRVAEYLAKHLHNNIGMTPGLENDQINQIITTGFVKTNYEIWDVGLTGGSTALVVYIYDGKIIVANAGHSRAVASNNGIAKVLSKDHITKDPQEEARIIQQGGYFVTGRGGIIRRLQGKLSTTRAFGNFDSPIRGLICEPTIEIHTITETDFLILGSNGLWDVVDNQQAIDIVKEMLEAGESLQSASDALKDLAYSKKSTFGDLIVDDITVILIDLKNFQ